MTLSSALLRAMFVVVGFEVMLKERGSPNAPGHQGTELCSWGSRRVNPMSVLAPHLTACAGVPAVASACNSDLGALAQSFGCSQTFLAQ